jgi:hypothetical protein
MKLIITVCLAAWWLAGIAAADTAGMSSSP